MIKGVGIDIIENSRILNLLKHQSRFLNKVLHESEIKILSEYVLEKKKIQFIASRWALKESLVKATKNKYIVFSKVYLNKSNDDYSIFIEKHDFNSKIQNNDNISFEGKNFSEDSIRNNEIELKYKEINDLVDEISLGKRKFLCSVSHEEHYSTAIVINTLL